MPWKECSVMDERLRFVAKLLDGESMSDVCREFGISRKTGYKIFTRYKDYGAEALSDRSRRPVRYANQLPAQIESLIVTLKREKPHWGARKIRELLVRLRCPRRTVAAEFRVRSTRAGDRTDEEEALHRGTDHWLFARGRRRHGGEGLVPQARLQ